MPVTQREAGFSFSPDLLGFLLRNEIKNEIFFERMRGSNILTQI
jgi:hypothetical protein